MHQIVLSHLIAPVCAIQRDTISIGVTSLSPIAQAGSINEPTEWKAVGMVKTGFCLCVSTS